MRTLLRPSGCAYPSLSTPRASGTAHTKHGCAHENVPSMRALLLVLLGYRADAAGLREERAYDNALVEPATLEPASPAKGGMQLGQLERVKECKVPVKSCQDAEGEGTVGRGVVLGIGKRRVVSRHCHQYFSRVGGDHGPFIMCRNSRIRTLPRVGTKITWPCQETNYGVKKKKIRRCLDPKTATPKQYKGLLHLWSGLMVKRRAERDEALAKRLATTGALLPPDQSMASASIVPADELQLPAEVKAAIRLQKRAALKVELSTSEGKLKVEPARHFAVDDDGKIKKMAMTMFEVVDAYARDSAKDPSQKLYEWNHATGEFDTSKELPFTSKKLPLILGRQFARHGDVERLYAYYDPDSPDDYVPAVRISAVRLYTQEDTGAGGTYKVLNGLLGQTSINVAERLNQYNREPCTGSALPRGQKYWIHVFRMLYHTVAEMQLRNAQLAIYRAFPRLHQWQKAKLQRREQWHVFQPGPQLKAVWSSPNFEADDYLAAPRKLYRAMCVTTSDDPQNPFSLSFYGVKGDDLHGWGQAPISREPFRYRGFTSTTRDPDALAEFANNLPCNKEPNKNPNKKLLVLIIHPMDGTPCYLGAGTGMSHLAREAEYLFRPSSHFMMLRPAAPCSGGYGYFGKHPMYKDLKEAPAFKEFDGMYDLLSMCVELFYVSSGERDPVAPQSVADMAEEIRKDVS